MVLVIVNQQPRLSKIWQKQVNYQSQGLSLRLAFSGKGQRTHLRCIKFPILTRAPCSLVARCGPNKRSGRFRRIQADANPPHIPGPDSTETPDLSSRPNAPASSCPCIFKLGWPLLLSIAVACFLFRRCTSPCQPRALQQLTPGQAAVAMISETPHPRTPLQRPAGVCGKQHRQQQAFASISAAGFARLFNGAQRAHLAHLLVYLAQRVSSIPSRNSAFGVDPPATPPSHLHLFST